jgi:nitrite reductase/ring-hydroxylating ferredoxin subunit
VRLGDGRIVAVDPICPHLGSPLTNAVVSGTTLECPAHWYAFDLDTGDNLHPGWGHCTLGVHATELRGGDIWVDLPVTGG